MEDSVPIRGWKPFPKFKPDRGGKQRCACVRLEISC